MTTQRAGYARASDACGPPETRYPVRVGRRDCRALTLKVLHTANLVANESVARNAACDSLGTEHGRLRWECDLAVWCAVDTHCTTSRAARLRDGTCLAIAAR